MAEQKPESSSLDSSPVFIISRVARLLRFDLWKLLEESGTRLTPEQYFMLYRLNEGDGRSQVELADRVLVDRPNVTRLLDALEKKHLVRRGPDATDRRRSLVYLTPEGRRLIRKLSRQVSDTRKQVLQGISRKEADQLRQILERIEDNVKKNLV